MHFLCYDIGMRKFKTYNYSFLISVLFTVLLSVFFTACASSPKKTEPVDKTKKIVHPRNYILNPYDGARTLSLSFNEYYYRYEGRINMWNYLKKDKPLADDKVIIRGRFKSNVKLTCLTVYLEDDSYEANYCTVLSGINRIMDIQPGTFYDLNLAFSMTTDSLGSLNIVFAYDGNDYGMGDFPKVGKSSVLTFEFSDDENCLTTNTNDEVIEEVSLEPQVLNIQLDKCMPFIEIATKYPVVNGVEDMTLVDNYQTVVDITHALNGYIPRKGDTINVTWSAVTDTRIRRIYARPVDCSVTAGGWRELLNVDWDDFDDYVIISSVKPDTPFFGNVTFVLDKDAVSQLCLCLWYDVGDAWPDGSAIIKMSK